VVKPMVNPQQHYLRTQIETASQPQLLLMLFDGAVRKLNIAKRAMKKKTVETAHNELTKVQQIFTELMVALDVELGGELANNLLRIYDFVYHHLVRANIKQDPALIDEVLPIVENLRDGWRQAVEKYNEEIEAGGNQPQTTKLANTTDKIMTSKLAEKEAAKQNQTNPAEEQTTNQTVPNPMRKTGTYGGGYPASPNPSNPQPQDKPRLNIRG